jgi:hypothetical protein
MKTMKWLKSDGQRKRAAVVAGFAASLVALTGSLSTASAAPTIWRFQNQGNLYCLTGSAATGSVWMSRCDSGTASQQWDWVGTGETYNQLQRRGTNQCLTTDNESVLRNKVWLGDCGDTRYNSQLWAYSYSSEHIYSKWGTDLRASPSGSDAVYAGNLGDEDVAAIYYRWNVALS